MVDANSFWNEDDKTSEKEEKKVEKKRAVKSQPQVGGKAAPKGKAPTPKGKEKTMAKKATSKKAPAKKATAKKATGQKKATPKKKATGKEVSHRELCGLRHSSFVKKHKEVKEVRNNRILRDTNQELKELELTNGSFVVRLYEEDGKYKELGKFEKRMGSLAMYRAYRDSLGRGMKLELPKAPAKKKAAKKSTAKK